jgi:uncharacterized membrane protein YeaQ/YmgE (transglycosylase-associated protein family)
MTDTATAQHTGVGRVSRALAPYSLRLTRWQILAAGIAGAWLVVWWRAGDITSPDAAAWLVRAVAALTAVTVAFAFDDPSVDATRALPASRGALMRIRFGVVGAVVAAALAPVVVVKWQYLSTWSTALGLAVEVCALVVLVLAVSLVLQRQFGVHEPAQFMVLVVVGLMMAAQMLGQRWPILVPPGQQWAEAHWRWTGVLVLGLLVMTWQLRDPASRPLRRSLRW